jgi:hypothetical protein
MALSAKARTTIKTTEVEGEDDLVLVDEIPTPTAATLNAKPEQPIVPDLSPEQLNEIKEVADKLVQDAIDLALKELAQEALAAPRAELKADQTSQLPAETPPTAIKSLEVDKLALGTGITADHVQIEVEQSPIHQQLESSPHAKQASVGSQFAREDAGKETERHALSLMSFRSDDETEAEQTSRAGDIKAEAEPESKSDPSMIIGKKGAKNSSDFCSSLSNCLPSSLCKSNKKNSCWSSCASGISSRLQKLLQCCSSKSRANNQQKLR